MHTKQHGITLVELMVALAVSAILLVGVGVIYGNSKRTYTVDDEFAHLQENARVAMKYLVEDIRMAGNLGCAKNDDNATNFQCYLNAGSYVCTGTTLTSLEGYEATGTGINNTTVYTLTAMSSAPEKLTPSNDNSDWKTNSTGLLPAQFPLYDATLQPYGPVLGSDIIVVHHADDNVFKVSADDLTTITTTAATNFATRDILIASDCSKARVFQATSIATGGTQIGHLISSSAGAAGILPGNSVGDAWTVNFTTGQVAKYLTHAYYIANGQTGPALFRHDGIQTHFPDELVNGVENMQIMYGIDTDATPDGVANRYDTANNINFTTAKIVSVRISILMRSEKEMPHYTASQTNWLLAGGTPATGTRIQNANDQRIRKVFTTTIKLRNKGL